MDVLNPPPVQLQINVTKGCDFTFTVALVNRVTGDPVDYAGDVHMDIDLSDGATTVPASIDGNIATITLTADICDNTNSSTRYRVINTAPAGSTPLVVGAFQRYD
jgi:hypothetical protein